MDTLDIFMRMGPMYFLGLVMILITIFSGHKDLLKFSWKAVGKWTAFLGAIAVFRYLSVKYFLPPDMFESVTWIPIPSIFMVWWEDAAHILPLLLLGRLIGEEKKVKPIHYAAMALIMVAFGVGHIYQGIIPSLIISLYIPVVLSTAKKHGLGTVMLGHILYDLSTILVIKAGLGLL